MKYLSVLFLIFVFGCSAPQEENKKDTRKLPHELRFTTFNLDPYKYVKVDCDKGRLKLHLRQYEYPKMEIHKSYQKYVRFNVKNDTLFIQTFNTPRNAKEVGIAKNINLYVPTLEYLDTKVSRVIVESMLLEKLKVINQSSSFRLYDSVIKNMNMTNEGTSNIQLDANNVVNKLYIKNNTKSIASTQAIIETSFTLESKDLLKANFKNIPPNGFHWIK